MIYRCTTNFKGDEVSNSVIKYWKGRLEDICPFHERKFLEDDAYAKFETIKRSTWPSFVSQRALYEDYCLWFSAAIVASLNVEEYAVHELPSPAHSRDFNAQMRPFLCLGSKGTTNKRIEVPRNYQGTWFKEQKFQRFYRLSHWLDHANAYTAITGAAINTSKAKDLPLTTPPKYESVSLAGHN